MAALLAMLRASNEMGEEHVFLVLVEAESRNGFSIKFCYFHFWSVHTANFTKNHRAGGSLVRSRLRALWVFWGPVTANRC